MKINKNTIKYIVILLALFLLLTSCGNGYKSAGPDNRGYEIIYKKLSDKEVDNIEKKPLMIMWAEGGRYRSLKECEFVVEINILDIDTFSYRREESISNIDTYFSIIRGKVINVFRGESELSPGDEISIKAEESYIYLQDGKLFLEVGKTYYMMMKAIGDSWYSKLADYRYYWDTDNYKHAMSMLED